MPGRDVQYAGEASYGSAPPGFVYQPNGYKTPQEQPRQSYNQNQGAASTTLHQSLHGSAALHLVLGMSVTTTARGSRTRTGDGGTTGITMSHHGTTITPDLTALGREARTEGHTTTRTGVSLVFS